MNRATDISSLPLVFSVPEAAQLIGIGKNTMYYIIKEGPNSLYSDWKADPDQSYCLAQVSGDRSVGKTRPPKERR